MSQALTALKASSVLNQSTKIRIIFKKILTFEDLPYGSKQKRIAFMVSDLAMKVISQRRKWCLATMESVVDEKMLNRMILTMLRCWAFLSPKDTHLCLLDIVNLTLSFLESYLNWMRKSQVVIDEQFDGPRKQFTLLPHSDEDFCNSIQNQRYTPFTLAS